LTFAERLKLRG